MRAHALLAVCLLTTVAAVTACGSGDGKVAAAEGPPVSLRITAPADAAVVHDEAVEVAGSVEPRDAAVQVLGRPAAVTGGTFRIDVPLEPGANVIDVIATAENRRPALAAVRTTREVPVEVPDLDGIEEHMAAEVVAGLGLDLDVERGGGLLDDILPGEPAVCEQDPPPDTLVRPGTVVRVVVAKRC